MTDLEKVQKTLSETFDCLKGNNLQLIGEDLHAKVGEAHRIVENLIIQRVSYELPHQKEIIAKGMELAKQGKLLNDKASIKDYLFGFIDGFRYTKQKIETKGNEELLVCDCKNTCDELTDVGEKVFKCKGLPK